MKEEMEPIDRDEFVEQLFQKERELAIAEARPPDPMLIYRKALIEERRRKRAKAMRPIAVVERLACLLAAAVAAGLLAWGLPEFGPQMIPTEWPSLGSATVMVLFGLSTVLFVSWLVFAEE